MKVNKKKLELYIFLAAALAAIVGFLFSRAILSISTITLCVNGFLWGGLKEKWNTFVKQPLLIGLTLLFLMPFLSGLWSTDLNEWWFRCQQKIPLLILPFSLAQVTKLKRVHIYYLNLFWILMVFSGTIWSLAKYLQNPKGILYLYKVSKVLPTWAEEDHIRFSMAIVIAILFWLHIENLKLATNIYIKWLLRSIGIWCFIFLHIISVKTGLIGIYLVIIPVYAIHLWNHKKRKIALMFVAGTIGIFLVAATSLPTLKVRINYIIYDHTLWLNEKFTGTDSDSNRILSLRAGWDIFKKNLLAGIGYGDIKSSVDEWFDTNMPKISDEYRFLPLNQWIFMGAGTGLIGLLIFSSILLLPFFTPNWRNNLTAISFWIFMAIVFLYESTIEDQRGVYIFCFFTMWWNLMVNTNNKEIA